MDRKAIMLLFVAAWAACASARCAAEEPFSSRGLRHGHMFLIWNEAGEAPKITLTNKTANTSTISMRVERRRSRGFPTVLAIL